MPKILHNGKALIIGVEEINGKMLDEFPDLKVIGCPMTGTEHLPWKKIKERNIKVISLKDFPIFLSTITSTSEHCIGLLLALMRNYRTALNPPYKERDFYKGHKLAQKTLLVIGRGRVGKQVLKIADSFGMNLLSFDRYDGDGTDIYLWNLIESADVISLHIGLSGNEGFFTKEMFQKMKPTACLINTSRDRIIEKGALIWALENKIISGAAVDFVDDLELVEYSQTHDNLILTNHISGNTFEDREKTENFIINIVNNYIQDNGH